MKFSYSSAQHDLLESLVHRLMVGFLGNLLDDSDIFYGAAGCRVLQRDCQDLTMVLIGGIFVMTA